MLFLPFQHASLRLKNRLVALPVFSGYAATDGGVSELLIAHYTRLAQTGVAMVVVANAAVSADGAVAANNLRADDDRFLPGLERLASSIKRQGAAAVLQLNHGGRFAKTARPLTPSGLDAAHLPFNLGSLKDFMNFFPLERRFGLTRDFVQRVGAWLHPMSAEQKAAVAGAFGSAAARAAAAGFDAVELHGATGYLISQFLSAFTHKHIDGSPMRFEERIRFPLEVVREVKRRLPAGFPVGFRLLVREYVPGGVTFEEAVSFAKKLESEGVCYLSPSVATYHSMFQPEVRAVMARPGYLREDGRSLKRVLGIPVVVSGRVLTPALAEGLLDEGAGDLIGLGRALRADPSWVSKARSGGRVRECRNCNFCLRRVVLEQGFTCARWPRWLQERTELAQRLLRRRAERVLLVVAGAEDAEVMRSDAAAAMIPFTAGASVTLALPASAPAEEGSGGAAPEWIEWVAAQSRRRGPDGPRPECRVILIEGPPEVVVGDAAERQDYGTILLARIRKEQWRERLLYRQRAKAIGLIGTHPNWSRVLVPLDLGPVSLVVLSHLRHSLMTRPNVVFRFFHVRQPEEADPIKRWREIRRVLGWEAPGELHISPGDRPVPSVILEEAAAGGYGTVVMGKRGISRIKQLLIGSVSSAVLRGLARQSLLLID